MAIQLVYRDIALGADEDAVVTTSETESFSDIEQIPFGIENLPIGTLEPNGWGLTRNYKVYNGQQVAFWSKALSNANCSFTTPPIITLTFTQQYAATGLTFNFNTETMEYASEVVITWYQNDTIRSTGTYYPDETTYIVDNSVEAFNRIVIQFNKTNFPKRRLKLEKFIIGVVRVIDGKELKLSSTNFINEINLISETIPINIMDVDFHDNKTVDFIFQNKQPVEAYNGDSLMGVYYIESGRRMGPRDYRISTQDYIGLWDLEEQDGGIWFNDTPLTDILTAIFGGISYFDISSEFNSTTLRGYIEPGTKRQALQQIAFAIGAVIDTSGTNKVKIFAPPTTAYNIPSQTVYANGDITITDTVSEVTVTAYVITDVRPSEGDSYIEYNGVKYKYYTDTKHAYNENLISSAPEKKIKFDKSYLVNLSNAQTLANNIMDYYMRRNKYVFKYVYDNEEIGDKISVALPWNDFGTGNITKMSLSCSGIIVSSTEALLE